MSTFCDWEQTTKVVLFTPKSWGVFTLSDTFFAVFRTTGRIRENILNFHKPFQYFLYHLFDSSKSSNAKY